MSKKFTERERTIGWLEENRKHGFFEGQMEEVGSHITITKKKRY